MAKEQADRIAAAALADEEPKKPDEEQPAGQGFGGAPFNAFAPSASMAPKIKEEPTESEDEKMLVVNDLRKCEKCGGKSYIRQGLCVNIYCDLYYMGRADAGTRLQARGKLGDGGQWNPKDWYRSGNFGKIEDEILRNEWKEQVHQLKGLPPLEEENVNLPKSAEEIFGKEPIVMEDLETGEVKVRFQATTAAIVPSNSMCHFLDLRPSQPTPPMLELLLRSQGLVVLSCMQAVLCMREVQSNSQFLKKKTSSLPQIIC